MTHQNTYMKLRDFKPTNFTDVMTGLIVVLILVVGACDVYRHNNSRQQKPAKSHVPTFTYNVGYGNVVVERRRVDMCISSQLYNSCLVGGNTKNNQAYYSPESCRNTAISMSIRNPEVIPPLCQAE